MPWQRGKEKAVKEYDYCKILAMNFGSTSTKIAVFLGKEKLLERTFTHTLKDMESINTMEENAAVRKPLILDYLADHGHAIESFDAIVGRGGLLRPIPGGTYTVNIDMLRDLRECRYGTHVCNLGGIIAWELGDRTGKPAFIVDPPVIDEMTELAHMSGHPDFPRRSLFHALNHKAIARRYAEDVGRAYGDLNLIICHIGGGVTVGAHKQGNVDAILLTGGLAYDTALVDMISEYVTYIAPLHVYPVEDEMLALAMGALRVMCGREEPLEYRG